MRSTFFSNFGQSAWATLVAILGIFIVGWLQMPQLNQLKNTANNSSLEVFQQEMESEELRLNLLEKTPVFGFDNLLANWVFLDFLEYFGDDSARQVTGYQLSPEYFEVILNRDPRFLEAYLFLSTSGSLYAGLPEKSVALMDKGLKYLSPQVPTKSYYIWRYKGVDELLFLGDAQAARQSFTTAAAWASSYSDAESQQVASLSSQTAEFLAKNPDSKQAQVSAWTMVLNNARDDRTRAIAIHRIEALGGKVVVTPEGVVQIRPPQSD
ncbi:MAG: hypothetical protein F6K47_20835 [Symploca sp. SIO2E6]|nr:hypothetical protein [Symploca sp. SIO2E6]